MKTTNLFKLLLSFSLCCIATTSIHSKELFVSNKGCDSNTGDASHPFKTINHAAQNAFAGDTITVLSGTYREWINPPRGGDNPLTPILYRAAQNETVKIKGSEILDNWKHYKGNVWTTTVSDSYFKHENTLKKLMYGDWFYDLGGVHHTADIYLNEQSLFEAQNLEEVLNPVPAPRTLLKEESLLTWFAEFKENETIVYANFGGIDPNNELVEVSARPTCFYPTQQGINYITIQGFDISQAASEWSAPTAEQVGMVAVHWGKGWIIENNKIHDTKSSGLTLGKEHSSGDNVWSKNKKKDGSLHYIETVFKALDKAWDKEHIGSHIVRYNEIYNCEQTGICGSMGCAFSEIHNNYIHDIWVKKAFNGAEIGGIKFHGPIETTIRNNYIRNAGRGIWLDWMTQGTRVSSNILAENDQEDLFTEVNHGPYIVDNNIMLSPKSLRNQSEGGAFIHNLFTGDILVWAENSRYTPYHLPHSTKVKGLSVILGGDDNYYNNLFITTSANEKYNYGLSLYDKLALPTKSANNLYANGAKPSEKDLNATIIEDKADVILSEIDGKVYIEIKLPKNSKNNNLPIIKSSILGQTAVSEQAFTDHNDNEIIFNTDFLGNERSNEKNNHGPINAFNSKVRIW